MPKNAQWPEKSVIRDGTRTHSLRLRKPTPCPFGHWDDTMPEVGFEPTRTNAQQILSLPPWTSRASRHSTTLFYKGQSKTVSFRPKKCKTKVLPGLEPGSQDSES